MPPFVWPQAAGISHPKVCTEQMRTEWVAWILVTIDFMEQRCQLIIPKQIRNEYSASGSKTGLGGYMPLSLWIFDISPTP